jgi:hypothetical protein
MDLLKGGHLEFWSRRKKFWSRRNFALWEGKVLE